MAHSYLASMRWFCKKADDSQTIASGTASCPESRSRNDTAEMSEGAVMPISDAFDRPT